MLCEKSMIFEAEQRILLKSVLGYLDIILDGFDELV